MSAGRDVVAPRGAGELQLADALLFQLALRGAVATEELAAAVGCDAAAVAGALSRLEADGLVVRRERAGTERTSPSAAGRARAVEVIAAEAAVLRASVAPLDAEFAILNRRVKQLLLRWQVRVDRTTEVPNDHTDRRYDRQVLAELATVHDAADALLAALAPLRPRYASLRQRLRDALERARGGDHRAVAGVSGDSFHGAWWELHGDLLAILGRARGDADA